jgi:hypothetical protein
MSYTDGVAFFGVRSRGGCCCTCLSNFLGNALSAGGKHTHTHAKTDCSCFLVLEIEVAAMLLHYLEMVSKSLNCLLFPPYLLYLLAPKKHTTQRSVPNNDFANSFSRGTSQGPGNRRWQRRCGVRLRQVS